MDWLTINSTGRHCVLMLPALLLLCLGSCGSTESPVAIDSSAAADTVADSAADTVIETRPPLIEATLAGNVDTVRELLQQGSDPNLVYHTNTALTYAARDGFTEIATLLIDHGADVNWIDGEGVTPLILAAFKNHIELVQLFLAHGADTAVRDQWNRTALDYALRRGTADPIVQLLREKT